MMEKFLPEKKINNILEIGAGIHPHHEYIKHDYKNYYCLENSKFAIRYLKKKYPEIKTLYSNNGFITSKKKFDRIEQSQFYKKKFIIGIGRLTKQKNFAFLI